MRHGQLRSASGSLFIQAACYAFFLLRPSYFTTSWKPVEFLLAAGAAAVGVYARSQGPHQRVTVISFEVVAVGLGAIALATRGVYLTGTIVGIFLLIQLLSAGAETVRTPAPPLYNPVGVPQAQQWMVQPPGAAPGPGQAPYGQPAYGQPAYGQPAYGQPAYGQPAYGQPIRAPYQPTPYQPAPYGQPVPAQLDPNKPTPIPAPDFGFYGPPVIPPTEPPKPTDAGGGWLASPPS